jgi:hypothetical protein
MPESTEDMRIDPADPEQAILHQDTYRKVIFGEVADPLFPLHPGAPESTEDELTRAALEDPAVSALNVPNSEPTFWRFVALLVFAVAALAVVFWWFR